MVQIWYMEPYPFGDPRLPHHVHPPKLLTTEQFKEKTGAVYHRVDVSDLISMGKRITLMKMEKGFNKEDSFMLDASKTSNFLDKLTDMFEEVEFEKEEARLVMEGACYFDLETIDGDWVRVMAEHGDLIIFPANVQHRFTTTPKNFIKMRRFYKEKEE
uniref:1,2-dihydroxy-3-keto-5-methylthiopentene dioxygenase homolog n=2 Tax=Strongyloides TaxID=6247 RepID=A0A0K0FH61_STRVS